MEEKGRYEKGRMCANLSTDAKEAKKGRKMKKLYIFNGHSFLCRPRFGKQSERKRKRMGEMGRDEKGRMCTNLSTDTF